MADAYTRYLPFGAEAQATDLSDLILAIIHPHLDPADVTRTYCTVIKHLTIDAWALVLNLRAKIPVASDADPNILDSFLQPFIDDARVSEAEAQHLRDCILVGRGTAVALFNELPAYTLANTLDQATAIAQGFIEDPDAE